MLPDVSGPEFLLVAAVALIVVGPKDLPALLRKVGQFVGRMRAMANDFRASFDEMARQSELDDLRREVEAMRAERLDPVRAVEEAFIPEMPPVASFEPYADPETSAPAAEGERASEAAPKVRKARTPKAKPAADKAKPAKAARKPAASKTARKPTRKAAP